MAEPELEWSADLKALEKQHLSRKEKVVAELNEGNALIDDLLRRLAEKEQSLKNARLDLDFEADGRRRWQQRATILEGKIQGGQHILVLVDGNQHFFKDTFLQAGAAGARDAVEPFMAEVRQFARDQHKHDLPESTTQIVHVFSDIDQLGKDLIDVLPDPNSLLSFCQEVCSMQPLITITDCGSGPKAVANKIQQFYELYIENCHCRHIVLALGHNSEYYKILQMYNDDEYTKGKTSLVRPESGFPTGTTLSYHTIDLSTLGSVGIPRHPVNHHPSDTQSLSNGTFATSPNQTTHETRSLVSRPNGRSTATTTITAFAEEKPSPPPTGPEPEEKGVSQTESPDEPANPNKVSKLRSTVHSSSSSNNTVEQTWETKFTENAYTHLPIQGDWGKEPVQNTEVHHSWGSPEEFSQPTHPPRKYQVKGEGRNNGKSKGSGRGKGIVDRANNSWTKNDRPTSSLGSRSSRGVPQHFQGSWDDMVATQPDTDVLALSMHTRDLSIGSNGLPVSAFSRLTAEAFQRKEVDISEPNPESRPIWSSIGINKLNQRIDLKLPRASAADQELFTKQTNNQKLCNRHHLQGKCGNTDCHFNHAPISDGVFLALRGKARGIPCPKGPGCRQHDCFFGHHCPNVSNMTHCGRKECHFKAQGMHEIKDLRIVKLIEPPPKDQM